MVRNNWRYIDSSQECYLLGDTPTHGPFMKLKQRTGVSYLDLFRRFIPDSLVQRLIDSFGVNDRVLGTRASRAKGITPRARKKNRTAVTFQLTKQYVYQYFAVYVKLVGSQRSSTENTSMKGNYATCVVDYGLNHPFIDFKHMCNELANSLYHYSFNK